MRFFQYGSIHLHLLYPTAWHLTIKEQHQDELVPHKKWLFKQVGICQVFPWLPTSFFSVFKCWKYELCYTGLPMVKGGKGEICALPKNLGSPFFSHYHFIKTLGLENAWRIPVYNMQYFLCSENTVLCIILNFRSCASLWCTLPWIMHASHFNYLFNYF